MFELHGFSLLTFGVLVGGIISHSLKQFRTARANEVKVTFRQYYIDNWPETAVAGIGSMVLWAGLPSLAAQYPEIAASIGLGPEVGVVSSFVCGIIGNSAADLVGVRARSITTAA